ncbi:hypothetical protein ACXVUM_17765 [Williamsia sp. SKLECPSW1]
MRYRSVSPDRLVEECASRVEAMPGRRVIAVDGADAADPAAIAGRLAAALRARGRAADVVETRHWVRAASLRMEWGRTDAHSYRTAWFDHAALRREVLDALRDDGRWLPRLWDAQRDRSFRDDVVPAGPSQVVIVTGPMLLGSGLRFDLTVALTMSEASLRRRTPEDEHWTIAPLLDDAADAPAADVEVRWDHPDRPAVREA